MTRNPCDANPSSEQPSPFSFASRWRPLNLTAAAQRLLRWYGFSASHPHVRSCNENKFSEQDGDDVVDIAMPDTIDYPPLGDVRPTRVGR